MADLPAIPLQFADIGNALVSGAHARYYVGKARQEENAFQGEQAARPDIAAAIGGDAAAQGRVAQASPSTFAHLAPHIAKLDADKRAQVKGAAEYTAQAANAILQANPADRPAVYQQLLEQGKALGYNMGSLPPAYSPALEPQLRSHRAMGISVLEQFKQDEMMRRHLTPGATQGGPTQMDMPGVGSQVPGPRADAGGPQPMVADAGQAPVQPAGAQPPAGPALPPQGAPGAPMVAQASPQGMPEPQVVQGDSPGPTPQVTGDAVALPPGTQPARPTGSVWNSDPSQHGLVMRGEKDRFGNVKPVEVGGHFLFRDPKTNEYVLYKPRAETPPDRIQPAPGFRWVQGQEGQRQEFIPGGNADPEILTRTAEAKRIAAEKAIPQSITKGMQENVDAMKQVDRALDALKANPDSVGGPGSVAASIFPGVGNLQNRSFGDPAGTQLRALIADIGSLKLHDRSGAAVTASEFPRLRPFIPTIADDAKTVAKKLADFRAVYEQTLRDTTDYYGADNGFRPYTPATKYLSGEVGPETAPVTAKPGERPPLESFQK